MHVGWQWSSPYPLTPYLLKSDLTKWHKQQIFKSKVSWQYLNFNLLEFSLWHPEVWQAPEIFCHRVSKRKTAVAIWLIMTLCALSFMFNSQNVMVKQLVWMWPQTYWNNSSLAHLIIAHRLLQLLLMSVKDCVILHLCEQTEFSQCSRGLNLFNFSGVCSGLEFKSSYLTSRLEV